MDDPDWINAKELLDGTPELNYMTQFVFLLFENVRVPVDSEERYKIEVHFSPGAKGREEIIASGKSISNRVLDNKRHNVCLKRMLPRSDDVIGDNLSLSNMPSTKVAKQTSRSLPTLMSKENIKTVRSKATQISIFEEEEESDDVDKPLILPDGNDSQDSNEDLCKCLMFISINCGY